MDSMDTTCMTLSWGKFLVKKTFFYRNLLNFNSVNATNDPGFRIDSSILNQDSDQNLAQMKPPVKKIVSSGGKSDLVNQNLI